MEGSCCVATVFHGVRNVVLRFPSETKRVWKVRTWPSENATSNDICLICKEGIHDYCKKCSLIWSIDPLPHLRWCRNVLMTLLCGRNCESSPLRLLDLHVISCIFRFCIEKIDCPTTCSITRHSNHVLHTHCYNRRFDGNQYCRMCMTHHNKDEGDITHRQIEWVTKHNVVIL